MNAKIKTVLAATDLSRHAFAAVRRAAIIALAHDARLELLHVIPGFVRTLAWQEIWAAVAQAESDLRESLADDLEALAAQIAAESGVKTRPVILEGKPFARIAAHSDAIDADVVVVGAHGENVLTTPWLGSTAHRVLRLVRRPVLLVKRTPSVEHVAPPDYEHIVVATDFVEDSAQAARSARRLFPLSSISLLHAYQAPFEAKLSGRVSDSVLEQLRQSALEQAHRELGSFAAAVDLEQSPRIARHGVPGVRIREYAADTSADLIAIGSEERPRLHNALLGSVSLGIVTQATCDVLLARAPER